MSYEEANGEPPPQGTLWLEAATPGPERLLITTQESNYLHALGLRASRSPQGPTLGPCPPPLRIRARSLHFLLPVFTYRFLSNLQQPFRVMRWLCCTTRIPQSLLAKLQEGRLRPKG